MDEAIRRANERVDEYRAETLVIDPGFAQTFSFANEAKSDGTYTIETLTEESRVPLTDDSEATTHLHTSEAPLDEPSFD